MSGSPTARPKPAVSANARVRRAPGSDATGTATDAHLAAVHEAEAAVDELEQRETALMQTARASVGVTGASTGLPRMADVVRASGAGWYPLAVLGAFAAVSQAIGYILNILAPDMSRALGVSKAAIAVILVQQSQGFLLASLQLAWLVQRRTRRALWSVYNTFVIGIFTICATFTTSAWSLLYIASSIGGAGGAVYALHQPLLFDLYRPEGRVRALSVHRAGAALGAVGGPLLVGALAGLGGLSWRGVLLSTGAVFVVISGFGVRLRDPGYGHWDTDAIRRAVRASESTEESQSAGDETGLGFFEIIRRVWLIPTVRQLLVAGAVLGAVLYPLNTFLAFHLQEHWNLGAGGRAAFFAAAWAFALPALAWFARRGESAYRTDPSRLLRLAAFAFAVIAGALVIGVSVHVYVITLLAFGAVFAATAVTAPALATVMLSVVRPQMRPHTSALAGVFLTFVGGNAGTLLLSGMDHRFGTAWAIGLLSIPSALAASLVWRARRTVGDDLDRSLREIVEDEELTILRSRATHLPMLACRHVDFAYGSLQVLFDVNLAVDDGEMVALLGTNGAGKSTLLRVISGLGLPSRGSVHFRGVDVTYQEAERRVVLGIVQIPGGRAVFGPMSVVENLRVFGYSHGRDRRAVERGIDATFDAFPRLAERRNQPASVLSGGEQQMLGLGKALIVAPRLLLIDELSLGLAPKIVAELLEMVRSINASGTAVVLVEQSVNVALSLVQHAYFMEKGEIRFDGVAADLLARRDLLRSVFLEGAGKGLA